MTGLRTRVLALGLASVLTLATGVSAATSPIAQQANVVATSLRTSVASSAVQDSLNSLGSTSGNAIAAGCAKLVVSCSFGKGTKVVVLYGDSHAVMWASAVVPALVAKGFKVVLNWMPGCQPAHIAVNTAGCTTAWRQSVEASVTSAKVKPKAVILAERTTDLTLAAGGTVSASMLTAGLKETIKVFTAKSVKVIVLGDNPVMMLGSNYVWNYSPASCVSLHLSDLRYCDTSLSASLTHTLSAAEKAAAISAKATFIDTTPWVCSATSNLCPVVLGSQVAYRDAYHLSDPYVVSITNVVSAALATPLGYK